MDFFVLFVVIVYMDPFVVIVLVDFFVAVVLVRFVPMVHAKSVSAVECCINPLHVMANVFGSRPPGLGSTDQLRTLKLRWALRANRSKQSNAFT